jgi:hypothetical protein
MIILIHYSKRLVVHPLGDLLIKRPASVVLLQPRQKEAATIASNPRDDPNTSKHMPKAAARRSQSTLVCVRVFQ